MDGWMDVMEDYKQYPTMRAIMRKAREEDLDGS